MSKIKIGILGATGIVGQRFVKLLENHPWFEVSALTGSDRNVGQTYTDVCQWVLPGNIPAYARAMTILPSEPGFDAQLAFSALPSNQARDVEQKLAKSGYAVCSNASTHRMWNDVPLLIPEVNPDHTALVAVQRRERGWKGFIVTNPNCTSTGLTIALRALHDAFTLKKVFVVSMQALSGAGYPGVASLDILDNVIPYISGEEEKVETEPRKMLGTLLNEKIDFLPIQISAHANRVAVSDGHMVCVSVEFAQRVSPEEATSVLAGFRAPAIAASLSSAPATVIEVTSAPDRPQPRRDRDVGNGMTTVVGRIRVDPIFHIKFVNFSHNTIRGAAGGAILNGELLVAQGLL
ncbi:MAG: aspartate-semialdehyde dehydrogenase [Chloroflexi bacterium GWB2_49_20]|nr:MAG: aspartate-semialdehyde dehydrogenase [Chloroflexi bacterium GWB2_49_20]OGN77749.1 MAG: aspartate-semialdehyde dehydrogenase [Chloroflexi bacterium GWC2_49_37]OGN86524.1 MAG: aspartate-semialdehyde dehydrogenase [Chloroflexi bacterium GWD2_49_16]HBG74777.1 aspartate-semialdehyde dehydrogenase [Anaerolineae bacterium]